MSLLAAVEQLEQSANKDEEEDDDEYTDGSSYTDDDEDGSDGSEYESESEEEDEEDEPVLKYKRFAKEVVNALQQGQDGDSKNVIQCMAVHTKFIALGTDDGTIRLLDHSGTVLKDREYSVHSGPVNQISIDEDGEFIACCSDDGKVSIIGMFVSKYNTVVPFDRPQKSVAIHPRFGKMTSRVFVTGSDKVMWVEEKRWSLTGNKSNELHSGYGVVSIIRWRDNYLAWANEKGVFVYDTALKYIITYVSYEEESPVTLPCSLCWARVGTLLVGRGHLVKVAEVKDSEAADISDYTAGVDPMLRKQKKHMAITCQNVFPEYLVSGVVPIQDGSQWNMVVLGYDANVDQTIATKEGKVPAPHLVVIPPGNYNQEKEEFNQPNEVTNDKLLPRGYAFCHCKEYHLECVSTGDEDKFYVLTPIDIIQAQKRDANDHVEWLLKKEKFSDAVKFAENPDNLRLLAPGKREHAGLMYIYHLIKTENFHEAARKCHDFLGPNDGQRWEDVMYSFMEHKQLMAILPFIPKREPKLNEAVYEMVLNHFLFSNTLTLHQLIVDWPSNLYNTKVVMNAVQDRLKSDPDNQNLLKVKAKLHEDMEEPDKALEIYLRLGDLEVFDLIRKRKLHTALLENLRYLMKLGEEHVEKTVELLVEFRISDCIPPIRVVRKLESFKNERNWEYFLHRYLDTLFDRDPKAGSEFHQRQVELYADYDRKKLLPFLRACNDIPLQKALEVCESRKLYDGMVFLLDRMGNPKASLEIIVGKLYDANQAIQFVRERDDEELWDTLIQLSKNIPEFITELLKNVGTHIDPTKLIKEIPECLKIENLGLSLVKLLNDYQLQVSLREGCKKIIVRDSRNLLGRLHGIQRRSVYIDNGTTCLGCGGQLEEGGVSMFFCGHVYHDCCVQKRGEMAMCHTCFRQTKSSTLLAAH